MEPIYGAMGHVFQGCIGDAFFASGLPFFLGTETVKNDFQLSHFVGWGQGA